LPAVSPNPHNKPTSFDELFSSLSKQYPIGRVVCSGSDFHGDGANSEVEIITTDGKLSLNIDSSILKTDYYFPFELANELATRLSLNSTSRSALLERFHWFRFISSCSISSLSNSSSICFGGENISCLVPFGNSSHLNASSSKSLLNSFIRDSRLCRESLQAHTREIAISQVIDIQEVKLSEHIYNLSTLSSVYSANDIIAHNCQPHKIEKEGKMQQEAPDKDEITACWVPRGLRVLKAMPNLEAVITLGWVAAKALLGGEPKSKTHEGNWFESTALPGIAIFCMVHPSFVLREPSPEKDSRVAECMKSFKREYLENKKCHLLAQEVKKHRTHQA
jgi:hypothetical protein